jgi:hypothetical protein
MSCLRKWYISKFERTSILQYLTIKLDVQRKTETSSLIGELFCEDVGVLVGDDVGKLVGPLVGPLVGLLVGPLVGVF